MLDNRVLESIDKCILCWLATSTIDGSPNVSPKEVFTDFRKETIIIANIASPNTVRNIKANPKVCLSLIDVLVQKGYQIKGTAQIITKEHQDFNEMEQLPLRMTNGRFPFSSVISITSEKIKPILAPSYVLFPDSTTEEDQIKQARVAYNLSTTD